MKKLFLLLFVSVFSLVLSDSLLASQAVCRKETDFDELGDVYKKEKVCLFLESSESEKADTHLFSFFNTNMLSPDASTELLLSALDIGLSGSVDTVLARGKDYLTGTPTIPQNFDKAAECFERVVPYERADASYELGILYVNGQGVEKNLDKARELFTQAAQLGRKQAYEAIFVIGNCFATGTGVVQDYKRAVSCYEQAIQGKIPGAYNNLGLLYLNGQGVDKDLDKARELFTQAARLDTNQAHIKQDYEMINTIGCRFANGEGVAQNYKKAVSCYEQAMQGKIPGACHNLGLRYLNGQGVDKNLDKARELFAQAANLGIKQAYEKLALLGCRFANGEGVAQDYEKAISCFEQAIQGKVPSAYYNLGLRYLNGQGVDKNLDKARELVTQAARLDTNQAHIKQDYEMITTIGCRFANGEGVAQDYKQAISCYEQAIQGKVPGAYYNLGRQYLFGQGVAKNPDKVLELFTQAADLGLQASCIAVYHCFAKGIRVQKNAKKADAYLKKIAETLGEQEAKKRVDAKLKLFLADNPKINCVGEMSVCPICTNPFVKDGIIIILACSTQALHIFCKSCFDEWRRTCVESGRPVSCPYCRLTNSPIFQGSAF